MLVTERGRALLEAVCPVGQNRPLQAQWVAGGARRSCLLRALLCSCCPFPVLGSALLLPRDVLPSPPSALSPDLIVPVREPGGNCLAACLRVLKSPVPVVQELTLSLWFSLISNLSVCSLVPDRFSCIGSSFSCSLYFPPQFFHVLCHSPYYKLYSPSFKALVLCPTFYSHLPPAPQSVMSSSLLDGLQCSLNVIWHRLVGKILHFHS